jgi:hypothetical protein
MMQLSKIEIESYQGIGFMDLDIEQPVLLVSGRNGSGKSSLRDAIEFAVTGVSSRVPLKKNYESLVRVGADSKKAHVDVDLGGFKFARKVTSGSGKDLPDYPAVLPHLLGSKRFADLDHKTQAKLLFTVTSVKRDQKTISDLLAKRNVHPDCIESVMPILRGGFAAGHKFCKEQQSMCRGGWEAITGERFGAAKADGWEAPEIDTSGLKACEEERDTLADSRPGLVKYIDELTEQAAEHIVAAKQEAAEHLCPACDAELTMKNGKLYELGTVEEVEETPAEVRQNTANNLANARKELSEAEQRISVLTHEVEAYQCAEARRAEVETKAAGYFGMYERWGYAADCLAPGGVPLQILESGLKPINDRLKETSESTGWKDIVIAPDLSLSYDGIPYGLCSESEQWRIDTAIVEAFALLSGVKLFIIDRFDVLHPADRGGVINWLVRVSGQHDTIILLGTLKNPPTGLPETIQTIWLDDGGEIRSEAA